MDGIATKPGSYGLMKQEFTHKEFETKHSSI